MDAEPRLSGIAETGGAEWTTQQRCQALRCLQDALQARALEAGSHIFASAEPQTAAERMLSVASASCRRDESQPWKEAAKVPL